MLLAVDVDYSDTQACVGGVLFQAWNSTSLARQVTVQVSGIAPYVPGQFYMREMPCILALLEIIEDPLDAIIIDGYVTLGADEHAGMGQHLWRALGKTLPIVGVAKTEFVGTGVGKRVYRNGSSRALFVTAAGMSLDDAKTHVQNLHGRHRVPEFLKAADTLCRAWPGLSGVAP